MEYKRIKRYFDIIFSLLGLVILLPLFVVISIAVRLESKGPIIYKQPRLGLNGRVFTMYKFRSMIIGAEKEGVYEKKGDNRVTNVGKFIRLTSIDELPQLINIFKGDMSFIGPRPPLTYHPWEFNEYTIMQRKRFCVLPGITGWAQVNGRKDLDWNIRIELDNEYVNKISFLFDIKILLLTLVKGLTMSNNLNIEETVKSKAEKMSLKLMYITNDEAIAKMAEHSGVDWIFIDLEIIGKEKRQGHLDTVISHHEREDVKKIKKILSQAKIIVRVNPIHPDSENEINQIIEYGADIIMLPYFKTQKEVEYFIRLVGGRVKTCLLCETPEAVENIDSILSVSGIDYMYIGLNDLHLGYKMNFMFYLLADGTVESLCNKFRAKGIPFGFGGIARLKHGTLPAEYIIREFYRLGSSMVILSRSFCNANEILQYDMIEKVFKEGVLEIRTFEEKILTKDYSYFEKNQRILKKKVIQIENILKRQKEII